MFTFKAWVIHWNKLFRNFNRAPHSIQIDTLLLRGVPERIHYWSIVVSIQVTPDMVRQDFHIIIIVSSWLFLFHIMTRAVVLIIIIIFIIIFIIILQSPKPKLN